MKLVFHFPLALVLIALMREDDDAVVLAFAGCLWMGVAIARSIRSSPFLPRGLALETQAASLVEAAFCLLLGLVTAVLVYGLAEQLLTLPGVLRTASSNGGSDRAEAAAIIGWTIETGWFLMAAAPTLVRARLARSSGAAVSILPAVWGLLGACLAGAPVALFWADFGVAWAQGFLSYSHLVDGLLLAGPAALPLVAGAELWRRSLAARDRIETQGLLRVLMLGGAGGYLAQAVYMIVEIVHVSTSPGTGAQKAAVVVGGVFLIAQAAAWMVTTFRLSRTPGASLLRTLVACAVLFLAMLATAIPSVAVLDAGEWAVAMAVLVLLPWLGCLALSQTLVVELVRKIIGNADGPRPHPRPA